MLIFTRQEQRFVVFLLVSFLLGLGVTYYKKRHFIAEREELTARHPEILEKFNLQQRSASHQPEENNEIVNNQDTHLTKKKFVGKVNINSANVDELQALPKIGPALAGRIIEYRKAHGPFTSIADIENVKGIGEKTFNKIKNHICVN